MKIKNLLKQLNEMDLNMSKYAPSDNKVTEEFINLAARKVGLKLDLSKNEEIKMNTNDLKVICETIYEYGYEDGANSEMNESLNEAVERFLSVEYNEAHPDKQTLVLYQGPARVDSEMIDLDDPLHATDQEVRELAKTYWKDITDDIRVTWY